MPMVVTEIGKTKLFGLPLIFVFKCSNYDWRAAAPRVALCNKLRELDAHVFALDYRGIYMIAK